MKTMTHYFVIRIDENQLKKDLESFKPLISPAKSKMSVQPPQSTKGNITILFEDPELNEVMSNGKDDASTNTKKK